MLVNLSMDIISSSKLTVFIEFHFQKTYSTLIHITFIVQNRQQRILTMRSWQWKAKGLRYFGTLSLQLHFLIEILLLLHSVIRLSAFDTLVQGDWRIIVCDRVIWQMTPQFSKHCIIAKQHERIRTKCSVFKIRKEQFICWYVKNEFWGQKCGYETDDLKNNLQLEVFDRESKPSGFIRSRLNWIHISFFPTAVGGINFKHCVTDCVYIRREAQSQR